jgi:hypothetical protein
MWEPYPICVVDIYHHICMVDWLEMILLDNNVGTLSNLCGGYLPPYLHGGLAMILMWEPYPICAVDIYHHICMVDWQ